MIRACRALMVWALPHLAGIALAAVVLGALVCCGAGAP